MDEGNALNKKVERMLKQSVIGKFVLLSSVLIGAFVFIFPFRAEAAASIYLSPPSGTFTLDGTFTVSIYVNTGGQAINAVEANLSFPPDKLQVVSPTTGRSLIQVWVSQPNYSNMDGTLTFRGTIPTPGINTDSGLISTITFRVKNIGTASVKILDTSRVLLNDGHGTDVLSETTNGVYYLTLPPPAGPTVISRTNTDQEKWYATKLVTFEWNAPPDTQGYSYILDENPGGEPDDISEGLKTRVSYNNLADGVYYFHIKALSGGVWGGITNYVIRVDNTPPAAFKPDISPYSITSNHRPIIDFQTTDAASGINHYELKLIPLDIPSALLGENATPFFIEVNSPYSRILSEGRYQLIIKAYDNAGNYYQSESNIIITKPFFDILSGGGLTFGSFTLSWIYVGIICIALLVIFYYLGKRAKRRHREVEKYLAEGPLRHPSIAEKSKALIDKQREREGKILLTLLLLFLTFGVAKADSLQNNSANNVLLEPPIVTLFPRSISNDSIVYIGGRASAPQAQVLIYLQQSETGSTVSQTAVTDNNGAWFYSFPQFLNTGHYIGWTQLKVGDELSPPSSRLDLTVEPTAIQIGAYRLSYGDLYFSLFILFMVAFLGLLGYSLYHSYNFRVKNKKLSLAIREAEESIRRGFAVLRHDIGLELDLIHRAKLSRELSTEEKLREEKLLKDFESVNNYISKEMEDLGKENR